MNEGTLQLRLLAGLLGLFGEKHSLDVWQHTTLGDGHAGQEFVQLLVVADGQLQVAWDDPALLVIAGGVPCKLEDFSCQVLHDGGEVHGGASSHSLGVVALSQVTVDTPHGELEAGAAAPGLALSLGFSSLSAA